MALNRLYVTHYGNSGESDLRDLFSKYGKVTQVECKSNYAFVEFSSSSEASEALRELNDYDYRGHILVVQQAHVKKEYRSRDRDRDRYSDRDRDRYNDRDRYDREYDRYDRDRYERDRERYSDRDRYDREYDRYDRDRYSDKRYDESRRDSYRDRPYDRRDSYREGGRRYSSRHDPPHNSDYKVYVSGLTRDYTWREVKDAFRLLGCDVCFADVKTTSDGITYGLAEFERRSDLEIALDRKKVKIGSLECTVDLEHPYPIRSGRSKDDSPPRRSPPISSRRSSSERSPYDSPRSVSPRSRNSPNHRSQSPQRN